MHLSDEKISAKAAVLELHCLYSDSITLTINILKFTKSKPIFQAQQATLNTLQTIGLFSVHHE